MSKRFAKVDINQPEIVKKLRENGYSVQHSHELRGFIDIIVGHNGRNYLFEIKQSPKHKLTEKETAFFSSWTGQVNIICSADDAINIIEKDLLNNKPSSPNLN